MAANVGAAPLRSSQLRGDTIAQSTAVAIVSGNAVMIVDDEDRFTGRLGHVEVRRSDLEASRLTCDVSLCAKQLSD